MCREISDVIERSSPGRGSNGLAVAAKLASYFEGPQNQMADFRKLCKRSKAAKAVSHPSTLGIVVPLDVSLSGLPSPLTPGAACGRDATL